MEKGRKNIGKIITTYILTGVLLFSAISLSSCKEDKINPATVQQIEELKAQIAKLSAENEELQELKAQMEASKDEDITTLTNQLETLNHSITNLNNEISSLQERIDSLDDSNEELAEQKAALQEQVNTLTNQKEAAEQLAQELQSIIDNYDKYTITFNSNGGSAVPNQVVYKDQYVTKPSDPKKTGYTFVKWVYGESNRDWNFSEEKVTDNITLNAVWSANTYTVSFNTAGGSPATIASTQVTYDSNFTLPSVSRSNYSLYRWECDGNAVSNGKWKIAKSVTLRCVWAKNVAKITYILNYEGAANQTQNVAYGASYTLLNPVRQGYTFQGWQYQGAFISDGTWNYLDDITVTAIWTANTYTLTLDPAESTIEGETSKEVTFDESFDLPVCADLNEDRPFAGWFLGNTRITDEEGHSLVSWNIDENKTLEAKYFHAISTKQDFLDISENPSTIYSLVNDIDFEGQEIEQLDDFSGTLMGLGYSIKNVSFTSDNTNIGLFKTLHDATFENITFENCDIQITGEKTNTTYYVGLLASQSFGTSTFTDVSTRNNLLEYNITSSKLVAGGLIGIAQNLMLDNVEIEDEFLAESPGNSANIGGFVGQCVDSLSALSFVQKGEINGYGLGGENDTTHTACELNVGGLVGLCTTVDLVDSSNNGIVQGYSVKNELCYIGGLLGQNTAIPAMLNCYNKGQLISSKYAGGLIGHNASSNSFVLSRCHNEGNLSDAGYNGVLGGLVGYSSYSFFIDATYNEGNITSTNGFSGGLIGECNSSVTIDRSYNEGSIKSSNGSAGGLVGTSITAVVRDSYNLGTIEAKTYAGGLLGVITSPSISNSYVGGLVKLTNDSASGSIGGFVGKAPSVTVVKSFIFATLKGLSNKVNSYIGETFGSNIDQVPSAATLLDLSDNALAESNVAIVENVSISTFTIDYIKDTLLFSTVKWDIRFDTSLGTYPLLKCFEEQ